MECKSIQSYSSSSTTRKYDVFVSFRGEDTRNNFTDHLFGAFQRKGIVAFRDDTNLKQGEHISTELMQAIEGSQVLIVVFSKNYATSSWCLQELAKIVDCINMEVPTGQSVLPIFYDVSPSEVRKQDRDYGKAFADYEERFKQDLGMVQRWRQALVQVANLSGWDVQHKHSCIRMHDKLQELGMKIVRQKAPNEPGKWSRLWLCKDFYNVMYEKMAVDNVEAIRLSSYEYARANTTLRADVLSKMNRLKFLIVGGMVRFSGSLNGLSKELRYLEWEGYPFTYFPSNCELVKLVELILTFSNVKRLWEGIKPMYNLKVMDLYCSRNLVKTPDFSGTPNLERLNLAECTNLVHIHPSIGLLRKLVNLHLANCRSLVSLPESIFGVSSLEVLDLDGCSKLFHSQLLENARHEISDTNIRCQSTSSIFRKLNFMLPFHFFNSTRHNGSVMPSLVGFYCLRELDISFCNILYIPDTIASLHCLERLLLMGNNFVTLPCTIKELPRLICLNLDNCKHLTSLSEFPLCTVLPVEKEPVHWTNIAGLHMFNCPKLVERESWSSIAVSWMIQLLKEHKECTPPITIVIPGTKIPSWFNRRRNVGCFWIEPNMLDSNWIGLAFCAAFVAEYDQPSSSGAANAPLILCQIRDNGSQSLGFRIIAKIAKMDATTVILDHLCLLYFTRQELTEYEDNIKETLNIPGFFFELEGLGRREGFRLGVRNYGMRLIFKQDLEELDNDE